MPPRTLHLPSRRRQRGAIIVTTALLLLFLLGFMGIALDFGRLFVVRGELQTAMDSCALAAARELDGQASAITRATSAGIAVGNMNRVNMQSASWSGQGQIVAGDISFRDAAYVATTDATLARYAQCEHQQGNIQIWLLKAMNAFFGSTGAPTTGTVRSFAVATRASAQSTCPIPVAMKPKAGGTAPNYGFTQGEWVKLLMAQNASQGGQIGWANLDGSNSASETEAELSKYCGTEVGDTLGTPGVQTSVADTWNVRFGIYKNSDNPATQRPDYTGYVYTAMTWPAQFNAYNGSPGAGAPASAQNFVSQRAAFAPCAAKIKGNGGCEDITGLSLNSFQDLASAAQHQQYGYDRRIVTVPVIDGASKVIDYACMLMLQPLQIPMSDTWLEFLGNAGAVNSPCTTSGLAGGAAGPLVPVLVR